MLRGMSDADFENNCKDSEGATRQIGLNPPLLKTQKDFIELAKITADRLRQKAEEQPEKILNDNQIMLFFE